MGSSGDVVVVDFVARPACSRGCGRLAAPGVDRKGSPLITCCRGCALGGTHDGSCLADIAEPGASQSLPLPAVVGAVSAGDVAAALEPGDRPLCKCGCGRPAAEPMDGKVFTTCCRGCARGLEHDEFCCQPAAVVQELKRLQAQSRRRKRWHKVRLHFLRIADPLWGTIEFKGVREGEPFSMRQKAAYMGFSVCPCLMVTCGCCQSQVHSGLTKAEIRRAWRKLLLSASVLIGCAQLLLFVVSLVLRPAKLPAGVPDPGASWFQPSPYVLHDLGAKNAIHILQEHEWWRLLMPIFLHGNWTHVLGNLLVQMRTCLALECQFGTLPWLAVYFGSGLYASLASCIWMPDYLSVGSSGALCGIIGAWLPFILITWNQITPKDQSERTSQVFLVVATLCIIVPLSFLPMTDWAAHFGGLLSGAAIACVVFAGRLQTRSWGIATGLFGAITYIGMVAASLYYFLNEVQPGEHLLNI
eukprot:TRINITY_DN35534_c0_g1_i1.p1 TRINITY_DN35534_c0_g1~~TRINITY_DN35534_c0_g1_i1.p1  ORF type:complete len:471 (+),score=69.59 TRINITY_DN35534_c0_g1_i1:103-1515(+)